MGLFAHFFKRPRVNQVYDERRRVEVQHEGEAWMELFIDLLFVAFFIKLGLAITHCQQHDENEWTVMFSSGFIFLIFFFLRLEVDMYANYFHTNDVVSRIMYFFFMMGVGCMAIGVPDGSDCFHLGLTNGFTVVGYIIAQTSLVLKYRIALKHNINCQVQLAYQVFVAAVITLLFALSSTFTPRLERDVLFKLFVPLHIALTIPFLGQFLRPYFNDIVGPYVFTEGALVGAPHDCQVIPLNLHAFQSRLCLFIMMVTGEGMIQIISPSLPDSSSYYDRIVYFNLSCFVILFGNAMLYSDAVIREDLYHHVMSRSPKIAGLFWTWMHMVTGFFIYLIGISIEIAIHDVYYDEPILHAHDTIMGIACGCIVLCLNLMRATHKGIVLFDPHSPDKKSVRKNLYRIANYIFRTFVGFCHFIVAYFTYHEDSDAVRGHDKYFYSHAAIVVVAMTIEISLSTAVKIKHREYPSETRQGVESLTPSEVAVTQMNRSTDVSIDKRSLKEVLLTVEEKSEDVIDE